MLWACGGIYGYNSYSIILLHSPTWNLPRDCWSPLTSASISWALSFTSTTILHKMLCIVSLSHMWHCLPMGELFEADWSLWSTCGLIWVFLCTLLKGHIFFSPVLVPLAQIFLPSFLRISLKESPARMEFIEIHKSSFTMATREMH